ncbi:hypothetical protein DFP72DRAFT_843096 [Ephemerocybe angulata]|uniref:Uncharacterized protein n=1 Tax=Ephemerocybe angulata TaxID=980116 RepID=A0A8H6I0B6_9AGAR|nr:hypothetical protein DFP72DRAFT_847428 [Tulosesus angulatus]KAF6760815.1 hypothetical protein DFP72DRAFT_843096 [Tulosesus angulatus]
MGRRAIYLTLADRHKADRARRAARMSTPSAIEARKARNRKAYLKRRGIPLLLVPEDAARLASSDIIDPDHIRTFWAFCKGQDELGLDDMYFEQHELEALTLLPPYQDNLLDWPDFNAYWPVLSAALGGFATQKRPGQSLSGRSPPSTASF